MPNPVRPGTWSDVLSSRRSERFVGRAAEIELFRASLDVEPPPFSVLYVHGPGGIGKSSLLDAFASAANGAGAQVARLDARDVLPSREAAGAAVHDALSGASTQTVLLLDSYERLADLDDWVRQELVPNLPAHVLTVLAGRLPPGPRWRADPAWQDLLRVIALRNLTPDEGREFCRRCGVTEHLHERLLQLSYGHPLGLSMLADIVVRTGADDVALDSPDLVSGLVEQFLDTVPDPQQRQALQVCALARITTEPLLRAALEVSDARHIFDWLRELSFVEAGPEGLLPHDLARDVIDRDLRWRDPTSYRGVFRRVRAYIHDAVLTSRGSDQQRGILDEKFVFRNLPSILSPVDWHAWGSQLPARATRGDRQQILDLVRRHEGAESAVLAERWLDRQPNGFLVLRRGESVCGLLGLLDLTSASERDRQSDPGAAAAWEHVQQLGGVRLGQRVTQTRFIIDHEAYQEPSATVNAVPIVTLQRYLSMPDLAWDFLTLEDPDRWNEYFALADLPRVEGSDFVVGSRRYGLFAHDFRTVPIGALLDVWTERALTQDATVRPPRTVTLLVLSQPDFAEAVRQGLRDLTRPDLLARNPLQRTRLVADEQNASRSDPQALAEILRSAVASLAADPRDDKLYRAVEQTYIQPIRTQEAAAARLGLPFSTYRRHLTAGVARVVSWCWEREIYGRDGVDDRS